MATNVRLSGAQSTPRSESDIRVNYGNASKIIAASNSISAAGNQAQFYSSDGGGTWNQTTLAYTGSDSLHSDPAVDWTSDGTAWAITMGISASAAVLRCYKSNDAGATWAFDSTLSGTQSNVDREVMWTDHSSTSPYKDQIYVIWHNGVPAFVARRTAGASGTWQTPVQISGTEQTGNAIGADIKTNSFGDVFAFYPDGDGSHKLRVAKSTDGGGTFGTPIDIATIFASSRKLSIPADSSRMARVLMSGGAYRTATKDLVYLAWPDLSGEAGCTSGLGPGTSVTSTCKTRIWFTRSTDGGGTWEAPRMLNNQSSLNDQFFSHLVVDETDGKLVVLYYDTVNDSGRIKSDIWMQFSTDDGVTWSTPAQITTAETDETAASADSGNQYGDYIGVTGYAGNFFGCWTDRRSGSSEEIWGAPFVVVPKACAIILNRNPIGQDEVDARGGGMPPRTMHAVVPDAIRVVVDGFTASELGLTGPGSILNMLSPTAGMTINCTGNTSDNGGYGPEVQRFTFHYDIDFGLDDTAFSFTTDTEDLTLNVTAGGIAASALLTLIKQPDPFMLHGDPSWLSIDLRFVLARQGESKFGVTGITDPSDAPRFIQQLIGAITPSQFDALPSGEEDTKLYTQPNDEHGVPVYNFALAKVHYIGLIGAHQVRVFFRLFNAQTTTSTYDYPPGAQYRRATSNPNGQPIPLAGSLGGEYVTLPFFATARIDTTTNSMDQQTDDPYNVQEFTAGIGGSEVDHIFGCWLDINQPFKPDGVTPNNVLPIFVPPAQDGPFNPSDPNPNFRPVPIGQAIQRALHQCLIAEVAFDPTPIPIGKDSSNWDKLAQRNIAWSDAGSAQALTTFEIRPTPMGLPADQTPDELMIDWGNTPNGSMAFIYLPAVSVDDILAMAARMYNTHRLVRADDHTLRCKTGGITYIPVPPGTNINYAGLLTIDLPEHLRGGQIHTVVVRQITNAFGRATPPPPPPPQIDVRRRVKAAAVVVPAEIEWRRVLGAFQLSIPVKTKRELLLREERDLSVLRWIAEAIPHSSRWHAVFHRYLSEIAGRVTVFGGDPTQILPSPNGEGRRKRPPRKEEEREERRAFTGKIAGLIFDHFGDFEGFILETEEREHRFLSREKDVKELAERAWAERLRITVWAERDEPHRPLSIIVCAPPALFEA